MIFILLWSLCFKYCIKNCYQFITLSHYCQFAKIGKCALCAKFFEFLQAISFWKWKKSRTAKFNTTHYIFYIFFQNFLLPKIEEPGGTSKISSVVLYPNFIHLPYLQGYYIVCAFYIWPSNEWTNLNSVHNYADDLTRKPSFLCLQK